MRWVIVVSVKETPQPLPKLVVDDAFRSIDGAPECFVLFWAVVRPFIEIDLKSKENASLDPVAFDPPIVCALRRVQARFSL